MRRAMGRGVILVDQKHQKQEKASAFVSLMIVRHHLTIDV